MERCWRSDRGLLLPALPPPLTHHLLAAPIAHAFANMRQIVRTRTALQLHGALHIPIAPYQLRLYAAATQRLRAEPRVHRTDHHTCKIWAEVPNAMAMCSGLCALHCNATTSAAAV